MSYETKNRSMRETVLSRIVAERTRNKPHKMGIFANPTIRKKRTAAPKDPEQIPEHKDAHRQQAIKQGVKVGIKCAYSDIKRTKNAPKAHQEAYKKTRTGK